MFGFLEFQAVVLMDVHVAIVAVVERIRNTKVAMVKEIGSKPDGRFLQKSFTRVRLGLTRFKRRVRTGGIPDTTTATADAVIAHV